MTHHVLQQTNARAWWRCALLAALTALGCAAAPPPTPRATADESCGSPGCAALVRVDGDLIRVSRAWTFVDVWPPTVDPVESGPLLRALAQLLETTPAIRHVLVEAHGPPGGHTGDTIAKAEIAAESIVTWLAEHGIDRGRLQSSGVLDDDVLPLAPPPSIDAPIGAEGQYVLIRIIDPASATAPE